MLVSYALIHWLCRVYHRLVLVILFIYSTQVISHQSFNDFDTTKLPNLGMTAAGTLSLAQEKIIGEQQKLLLRRHVTFITDPLINQYFNQLGQQLAKQTQFPSEFNFYIIDDSLINAFATFGGNIYFYTGLIQLTETESQLASVLAHEISHVTQRHLASHLEKTKANAPFTLFSTAASILLSLVNSEVGAAMLTSTLAGNIQTQISYTQQHEREADTLGLALLRKSGFEPNGMTEFMQRLAEKNRYGETPPEILLTHPLTTTRIAYVKNRITQFKSQPHHSSLDYYLAQIRLTLLLSTHEQRSTDFQQHLLLQYQQGNLLQKIAFQYGQGLLALKNKEYQQAQQYIGALLKSYPNNVWFIDAMTDIDLALKQPQQAVKYLNVALNQQPNQSVLQLNFINASIEAADYSIASNLLHRYTHRYPEDINGWNLAVKFYGKTEQVAERYSALAELVAIEGDLDRAISLLVTASQHAAMGSHTQARIDAKIARLQKIQQTISH